MTDEEIRKLAREYAEDIFGKDDYPFKEDDMCNAEDDFESVVEFLSKKFCIVEKEKARELARLTFENGGSEDEGLIDGLVDWVCDNFDEEYREEAEK